jgi:hypothetical protein
MAEQSIRYPSDMAIEKETDYFSITLKEYVNPDASGIGNTNFTVTGLLDYSKKESIQIGSVIYLPMPSNLQDSNAVSWGESKMNNLTAAGVAAGGALMDIDLFNLEGSLEEVKGKLGTIRGSLDLDKIITLGKTQLSAEAVNVLGGNVTLDQILARSYGQIVNQNNRLLFNGVTLREFNFSFKLTPRNEEDRDNIKKIIRTLKVHMSAKNNSKEKDPGTFIKTPGYFDLQYRKGNTKHPFLPSFKECALKNMAVNYTGENVYATYHDGTPVSMQLDLSFQEVVPVYAEDYTDSLLGVGY